MQEFRTPRKRSLVIHDIDKYREAMEFEHDHSIPFQESLRRSVHYLLGGSYWEADELHITPDSCKHSFGFWFTKDGKPIGFNGGIILHGLAETHAVRLCPSESPLSWSVHT